MRKPAFCICQKKGADQLCGNCAAVQRGCTAKFLSDLVGNPENMFSHDMAHMFQYK